MSKISMINEISMILVLSQQASKMMNENDNYNDNKCYDCIN